MDGGAGLERRFRYLADSQLSGLADLWQSDSAAELGRYLAMATT
ncbi:MAG: hypothetical protein N0E59_15730 [Candidatus Thiodiazotropha taylori]|nr:hypothetical protein [Candidatus Thiodiazotropha taylori]MCW4284564.1 hypothetical protein [Candidatus Thiodiazotropha taylori]MCW4303709.1 hypothetical protein [Candidatus Thiodiazotropha taylori]